MHHTKRMTFVFLLALSTPAFSFAFLTPQGPVPPSCLVERNLHSIGHARTNIQGRTAGTCYRSIDARGGRGRTQRGRESLHMQGTTDGFENEVAAREKVLKLVENTDRGADAKALPFEKKQELYAKFDLLEAIGADKDLIAEADSPALGKFEVTFVGERDVRADASASSSPAGGYWRGKLARRILQTTALYQHVLRLPGSEIPRYALLGIEEAVRLKRRRAAEPSVASAANATSTPQGIGVRTSPELQAYELLAVNAVCLRLFCLVPIIVILCGLGTLLDEPQRRAVQARAAENLKKKQEQPVGGEGRALPPPTRNTARVDFAPPVIAFGPAWMRRWFKISIGPCTDVFLDTTYAAGGLRLARGATSGSRFAFSRVEGLGVDGCADAWEPLVKTFPWSGRLVGTLLIVLGVLRALVTYFGRAPWFQALVSTPLLGTLCGYSQGWVGAGVFVLLGSVLRAAGGGIVRGEERRS